MVLNLIKKEKIKGTVSITLLVIGILLLTLTPTPLFTILGYTLNGAVAGMIFALIGFISFIDYL